MRNGTNSISFDNNMYPVGAGCVRQYFGRLGCIFNTSQLKRPLLIIVRRQVNIMPIKCKGLCIAPLYSSKTKMEICES